MSTLSCYTSNLVGYLEPDRPDAAHRLADAVRLRVRTDGSTADTLTFSHHDRIDLVEGTQLGYRSAFGWAELRAGLTAELDDHGRVLAVANTGYLPWSPEFGSAGTPHWVLIHGVSGRDWHVTDRFTALLPAGEQHPFEGTLREADLRGALNPVEEPSAAVRMRDAHALGTPIPVPGPGQYRWLAREPVDGTPSLPGEWLENLPDVLAFLADRLGDSDTLARHLDDLWAAGRHYQHRLITLGQRSALDAAAKWAELPRTLRFAADSAARGKPRPSLVQRVFDDLDQAMSRT